MLRDQHKLAASACHLPACVYNNGLGIEQLTVYCCSQSLGSDISQAHMTMHTQKALSPLQSEWLSSTQQPPVSSSTQQPATHTGNSNKLWSLEDQVTSGRLTVPLPLSLGGAAAVDQARVLSLGLPFHSTDIQEFRDVLQELMFIYTISGVCF